MHCIFLWLLCLFLHAAEIQHPLIMNISEGPPPSDTPQHMQMGSDEEEGRRVLSLSDGQDEL